ncbi:MAG: hypothetical protein A4E62_03186 [Syntrophorhabdus sp. PtaU1.Bin002]|nr:MAG: hypothetical protein A4E62_03186 [Syntrophorhabdus sp. PtaU1.Bin002]
MNTRFHQPAQVHDNLSRDRKLCPHILKHCLKNRDNENKKDHNNADGHHDDADRVNHGRFDLLLQFLNLLHVEGQSVEDRIKHTAFFTGHNKVNKEFIKTLRIVH